MTALRSYDQLSKPRVLLRVDGQDADDLVVQAGSWKVEEDERHATKLTVEFPLMDVVGNFADSFLEDPRFQPGAEWLVRWGFFDALSDPLLVKVLYFEPKFPENGAASVTLHLTDKRVHMNRDTSARNWGVMQTSDIARQIAARYGMEADIKDSGDARRGRGYVQTAAEPDIQFLQRLGNRIRFVCYVENNTLHYHPARWNEPAAVLLEYNVGDPLRILQSFSPVVTEQLGRRTMATGEDGNSTSTQGGQEQDPLGRYIEFDLRDTALYDHGVVPARTEATPERDAALRQRRADARRRQLMERVMEANAKCLGLPTLRRDTNVQVVGVGRQLSGVWHVKTSAHTIDARGYSTTLKLKRGAASVPARGDRSDAETTTTREESLEYDLRDGVMYRVHRAVGGEKAGAILREEVVSP